MLLYRITDSKFAADLTGEGSYRFGGRWSPAGVRIIHASESVAICCMEVLVHVGSKRHLTCADLSLVSYEIDDKASINIKAAVVDGMTAELKRYKKVIVHD